VSALDAGVSSAKNARQGERPDEPGGVLQAVQGGHRDEPAAQYQKRLRLLEARRLMVEEGMGAEVSAYRVGYTSASRFSREVSRMFDDSPLRDSRALKQASAVVQDM
jgi:AraC-like DNA-binding protein